MVLVRDRNRRQRTVVVPVADALSVIEPEQMLNALKLFPNPAKDQLFLNIPSDMTINALKVYDLNGRLLQLYNKEDRLDRLSIGALKSGFYYLSIETPDRVINKKFVKH